MAARSTAKVWSGKEAVSKNYEMTPSEIPLHHECLVAPLEHVTRRPDKAIEAVRKDALQPLHALRQVRRRCPDREVIVVRHHHVGQKVPPKTLAGLKHLPRP